MRCEVRCELVYIDAGEFKLSLAQALLEARVKGGGAGRCLAGAHTEQAELDVEQAGEVVRRELVLIRGRLAHVDVDHVRPPVIEE